MFLVLDNICKKFENKLFLENITMQFIQTAMPNMICLSRVLYGRYQTTPKEYFAAYLMFVIGIIIISPLGIYLGINNRRKKNQADDVHVE